MKDCKLSEISETCKQAHRDHGRLCCRGCKFSELCEVMLKLPPRQWELERRESIEIPSKIKIVQDNGSTTFSVLYRDRYGTISIYKNIDSEATADMFIKSLKDVK